MPRATYTQSSFLGGEWSPQTQGRFDREDYRTGMNVARNVVPNEEGSAPRRPGTRFNATTRSGAEAVLREFHFDAAAPYLMEFSASHLRFFAGRALVLKNERQTVLMVSAATPAEITTGTDHGWTTGDQVSFILKTGTVFAGVGVLINRQFTVTVTGTDTFTLADAVTGTAFDGSLVTLGPDLIQVDKVLDFATPYAAADLDAIRVVQDQDHCLALHGSYPLRLVASEDPSSSTNFATFTFDLATLIDGPYYDPPRDGSSLTVTGTTGVVIVDVAYDAYAGGTLYKAGDSVLSAGVGYVSLVNNNQGHTPASSPAYWEAQSPANGIGPNGFVATDVGRHVRLFYEPADWAAGTSYAIGASVKFDDAYYTALTASTGKQPDTALDQWAVATTAAAWTWGIIVSRVSETSVTLQITGDDLIDDALPIKTYRMGLYSDTTGYPHHGVFHDGRLWLAGPVKNRLDGSMSNEPFTFSPTTKDGTVADNNACAEVIKAKRIQSVRWMLSTDQGILVGTQGGEWLLHASQQNDPITPTSVQQNQVTQYGCEDIEPIQTPNAVVFVQRYGRKVLDYTTIAAAKYAGTNISNTGKHLIVDGLDEICYQTETSPVLWGRTDGRLVSCTYKRELPIGTQPPSFAGWARHDLGSGRSVRSICAGPDVSGDVDAVSLVTYDPDAEAPVYFVETLTNFLKDTLLTSWYVDAGTQGAIAKFIDANTIRFYGLGFVAGETIDVWLAGLDLGSRTVTANGYLDVDLASDTEARLTAAYLQSLTDAGTDYKELGVRIRKLPTGASIPPSNTTTGNYPPSGSVGTTRHDIAHVDWARNRLFTVKYGAQFDTPDAGFRSFNIATRAVIANGTTQNWLDQGGGLYTDHEILEIPPSCVAPASGDLYWQGFDGKFKRIDGATLLNTATSGVLTIEYCNHLCGHDFNGSDVILCVGQNTKNLRDMNGATMTRGALDFQMDEMDGHMVAGPKGDGWCTWYVLGYAGRRLNQGDNTYPLRLYTVTKTATDIGVSQFDLNPHDFQADWTHFGGVIGLAYDQSDGGVIFMLGIDAAQSWVSGGTYNVGDVVKDGGQVYGCLVAHGPSPDHQPPNATYWEPRGAASYVHNLIITKVLPTTGEVAWATGGVDASLLPQAYESLSSANITGGGFSWISSADHGSLDYYLYTVASNGTLTSKTVHNLGLFGAQFYNDVTGDLVGFFTYNHDAATNNPAPEGSTGSAYAGWGVLRKGTGGTPYDGVDSYYAPAALGYGYVSQWQILRPNSPQESGTQNGPGFGKTRRSHRYACLVHNTKGLYMGTDFTTMRPVPFTTDGGTDYTTLQLFSGLVGDTLEDGYSYDSMLACQITRPYPGTILTLGAFDQTQDR